MTIFSFIILSCFVLCSSIMLKKDCPPDETHRSCSFYDEYTCWTKEDRDERVRLGLKRLLHCKSGCFCKKGFVREYPDGPCIITSTCRDQRLKMLLEKIPNIGSSFH